MFNLPDLNNNKSKGYCVTSAVKASIVYPVMKDVLEVISILSNCWYCSLEDMQADSSSFVVLSTSNKFELSENSLL